MKKAICVQSAWALQSDWALQSAWALQRRSGTRELLQEFMDSLQFD